MATVESRPPADAHVVRRLGDPALTPLTSRHVTTAMWVMVVVQLVARGYASGSGYLYWDDFILQSRAARLPFPSVDLLLTAQDGHLEPAAMAAAWLTTRIAPLSPLAVTVCLLALQLLASAAVVLMLRRVFGARPLVLVPLAVYLFSPLTLPSFLWWSAALSALPLQAGLAVAIWSHVGYLRTGRRSSLFVTLAAMVTTLAFSEKAVVIGPALLGVTWVLDSTPGVVGSLWAAVRRHWRLWVLLGMVTAGYVAGSATLATWDGRLAGSPADVVALLRNALLEGFLPATVGGPVSWDTVGYANALAAPPAWLVVLAVQVALVVVAVTCWARPAARRGWIFLLGYLVLDLAVVELGRGGSGLTLLLPLSLRSTADAAVVLSLVLGAALMAPVGVREPVRVVQIRGWLRARASSTGLATFVAADVFILLCLVSTLGLTAIWRANPAREWVENAQRTSAAVPAGTVLLPDPVPDFVLDGLSYPENLTSYVLAPVHPRLTFGSQSTTLSTFDGFGNLGQGRVEGAQSTTPPQPGCWPVELGRGVVRLDVRLAPGQQTVHLRYQSFGATAGTVALGAGEPEHVQLAPGTHDVYVRLTGGGSLVYVTAEDPAVRLCVDSAEAGTVVPDYGDTP